MVILKKDRALAFPHIIIVEASAGSGKTYLLSLRFVQFLLSKHIPANRPENMLAITFTNNAANEMKERILKWLKKAAIGLLREDEKENLADVLSIPPNEIKKRAQCTIEEILDNYTDLNISTIDSFLTGIARASALELGFPPDFELVLDYRDIIDDAFYMYLDSLSRKELDALIEELRTGNKLSFQPSRDLLKNMYKPIKKITEIKGSFADIREKIKKAKRRKNALLKEIETYLQTLVKEGRADFKNKVTGKTVLKLIRQRDNLSAIRELTKKKLKKSSGEDAIKKWDEYIYRLRKLSYDLSMLEAYSNVRFSTEIQNYLRKILNTKGKIYLAEMTKKLQNYLEKGNIPEIYFNLGNSIKHFLIDEFQDTNEPQWIALKSLIEEALSTGGSLFVVGDIKQAIYGFRGSDYRIMQSLIASTTEFPSVPDKNFERISLDMNYRSGSKIVEYVDKVFKEELKGIIPEKDPSGFKTYRQKAIEKNNKSGFVKTIHTKKDELKDKILAIIKDAKQRGYSESDMAILSRTGDQAIKISDWLMQEGYNVISEVSTDIRDRKIIQEISYLLQFLDSPIDNFSFSIFLMGDIAEKTLGHHMKDFIFFIANKNITRPYYIEFKKQYPLLWSTYFEGLINEVGYLSTYDIVLRILAKFKIAQHFRNESYTVMHLLDMVLHLEEKGKSSIKHFIEAINSVTGNYFEIDTKNFQQGIRVLTIHRAKGLEYEIVINIIAKSLEQSKSNGKRPFFVLTKSGEVEVLKIRKIKDPITPEEQRLKTIYEQRHYQNLIEELNLLYVAMTRAKKELYNILITDKEKGYFISETEHGNKTYKAIVKETPGQPEHALSISFTHKHPEEYMVWTSKKMEEVKRGDFYHAILSEIIFKEDLERLEDIIEKYSSLMDFGEDKATDIVKTTVMESDISQFFDKLPKRHVLTEKEFIDKNGNIIRMDRVIIDEDVITVIDFKTGKTFDEEKYIQQIKKYMDTLGQIYKDKEINGIIYNIDTAYILRRSYER